MLIKNPDLNKLPMNKRFRIIRIDGITVNLIVEIIDFYGVKHVQLSSSVKHIYEFHKYNLLIEMDIDVKDPRIFNKSEEEPPILLEGQKEFEIWRSGYSISGNDDCASFIGKQIAKSFKEACDILCKDDADYDSKRGTTWGCRLFDNETDARKSFG